MITLESTDPPISEGPLKPTQMEGGERVPETSVRCLKQSSCGKQGVFALSHPHPMAIHGWSDDPGVLSRIRWVPMINSSTGKSNSGASTLVSALSIRLQCMSVESSPLVRSRGDRFPKRKRRAKVYNRYTGVSLDRTRYIPVPKMKGPHHGLVPQTAVACRPQNCRSHIAYRARASTLAR